MVNFDEIRYNYMSVLLICTVFIILVRCYVADYSYKLELFEGPLDLLLHLIEKHKIDIYEIPIVQITTQYLDYITTWNRFDIHYSSEFLVMAATLLQIKSRMLLPAKSTQDETEEDPRDELVQRLVEFKAIKSMAELFSERIDATVSCFSRPEEVSQWGVDARYNLVDIPFYDLFHAALLRMDEEPEAQQQVLVQKEVYSIAEATQKLFLRLQSQQEIYMADYLLSLRNKRELVATFLAILEQLKLQYITIRAEYATEMSSTQPVYVIAQNKVGEEPLYD